jgi:Flp pilus assembly protein TadD
MRLAPVLPLQEREAGNDAFALGRYDSAVAHYSQALALCATDAVLWSNRAAAYLAKGW